MKFLITSLTYLQNTCSFSVVCLRLWLVQWSVLLQLDVRGHRLEVADPVQWHSNAQHWSQHGPHRWVLEQTKKKKKKALYWCHKLCFTCFSLSVNKVHSFNRWIREFHLHISDGSSRDRSGSARESSGQLPGLWPVCVLLVPHVWVAHWHSSHQTAQTNWEWTCWHPSMDS